MATAPQPNGCRGAQFLKVNTTVRLPQDGAGQHDAFLRLKAPGVLTLFVSAPWESSTPSITLLGCDGEPLAQGVTTIRETPQGLILNVETPGDLLLRIHAQEPGQALPDYKLRVGFAAALWAPDEILPLDENPPQGCGMPGAPVLAQQPITDSRYLILERGVDPQKDVDPWDCDIIEGDFADSGVLIIDAQGKDGSSLRASIYREGDCGFGDRLTEGSLETTKVAAAIHGGSHRLLLEPLDRLPVHYALGVQYFALCHLGELDDHADHPLCSSEITFGEGISGILSNPTGDDEDYFTFRIREQEVIMIETSPPGVGLELYDERDQLLDAGEAAGDAGEAAGDDALGSLVRTLVPGRYYVRVVAGGSESGDAEEVGYRVRITSLDEV
jgi:hypothetical protein